MMKERPKQEIHHDSKVWVNPTTESLRRTECLCFNCDKSKPGQSDHCRIASSLYQICVKENVAFALTRCPAFSFKDTKSLEELRRKFLGPDLANKVKIWKCENCDEVISSTAKPQKTAGCTNGQLHDWYEYGAQG